MDKKAETLRAHPAADAYRLMTGDELAELAESIKANGLRDPITVGIIGKERWIVDGRNREKACGIAGVPPEYEEIEFADEAALKAFVADRNERRNISKGQKAMAYATLFPEPVKLRRKGSGLLVTKGQFSEALLSQARAVLAYSPELATQVRDGASLGDAFKEVETARIAQSSAETMRAVLQAQAPDLLELVDEDRMKLTEANTLMQERQAEAERLKKHATLNLARLVDMLNPRSAEPERWADMAFGKAEPKYWPHDATAPFNQTTLEACAKVAAALAAKWRE